MLVLAVLGTQAANPDRPGMVYRQRFNAYVQQIAPTSVQWAKSNSRFERELVPHLDRLSHYFKPATNVRRVGSIWFAVRLKEDWLLVDQFGFAQLGDRYGHFAIVEFEKDLRRWSVFTSSWRSELTNLRVRNNTSHRVEFSDPAFQPLGSVGAGESVEFVSWLCPNRITLDGRFIGSLEIPKSNITLYAEGMRINAIAKPSLQNRPKEVGPSMRVVEIVIESN